MKNILPCCCFITQYFHVLISLEYSWFTVLGQFQMHLFSVDCSLTDQNTWLGTQTTKSRRPRQGGEAYRFLAQVVQAVCPRAHPKTLVIPCSTCMAHQSGWDTEDVQTAFNSFHQQMRVWVMTEVFNKWVFKERFCWLTLCKAHSYAQNCSWA